MHDVKEALIALKADGFTQGQAWLRAHSLAQRHEGETVYDRLHALLHRIEGDQVNAEYWYRRSGEPAFAGDIEKEAEQLMKRLE